MAWLPYGALRAIPHADEARVEFQAESSLTQSSVRNMALLDERVRAWTGLGLHELSGVPATLRFDRVTEQQWRSPVEALRARTRACPPTTMKLEARKSARLTQRLETSGGGKTVVKQELGNGSSR